MQAIAAEDDRFWTVFSGLVTGGFDLRWFTPTHEAAGSSASYAVYASSCRDAR